MTLENFIDFLEMQKGSFSNAIKQNNMNLAKQNDEELVPKFLDLHWQLVQMEHTNNCYLEKLEEEMEVEKELGKELKKPKRRKTLKV